MNISEIRDDDITEGYIERRQTRSDPAAILNDMYNVAESNDEVIEQQALAVEPVGEAAEEEDKRGVIADTGVGIVKGATDGVEEVIQLVGELATGELFGLDIEGDDDEIAENDPATLGMGPDGKPAQPRTKGKVRSDRELVKQLFDVDIPDLGDAETTTGGIAQGLTQFLVGFIPAGKALKAAKLANTAVRSVAAGAIADFSVFDPQEERLSNFLTEVDNPILNNAVTQYLSANEDDGALEGRIKSLLEGGVLGLGAEGTVRAVGGFIRGLRVLRRTRKESAAKNNDPLANAFEEVEEVADDFNDQPVVKSDDEVADELADDLVISQKDGGGEFDPEINRIAPEAARDIKPTVLVRVKEGMTDEILENPELLDQVDGIDFNFDAIETSNDIKQIINDTSDLFADEIDAAKGGERSFAESIKLADELGIDVGELNKTFAGSSNLDGQIIAARRVLIASAKKLQAVSKLAVEENSDRNLLALQRQLTLHAGIQAEFKGVQTNIARAMNAFKIKQGDAIFEADQLKTILDANQGKFTRTQAQELAIKISHLEDYKGINALAQKSLGQKTGNAILEWFINGLLSGPRTQVVNLTSNALVTVNNVNERFMAAGIGKIRRSLGGEAGDGVTFGEVKSQVFGMRQGVAETLGITNRGRRAAKAAALKAFAGDFKGARDLLKAEEEQFGTALRTFASDEPVLDNLSKFEHDRRAISAEALGVSNRFWGGAVDVFGSVVRIPGRALLTGDELFKGINYRSELHALAYRNGTAKGLKDADLSKYIADQLENPTNTLHIDSLQHSRVATFTNELGKAGKAYQNLVSNVPVLRVVTPFIRTPINIVKYAGVRTPGLNLLAKSIRADMKGINGAAAQEMAMARTMTGAMLYTMGGFLASEGKITGAVPPHARKAWELDGKKEYAFVIGDQYIQYNRTDPFGMFLGLAADFSQASGQIDDNTAQETAAALIAAMTNNLTSKTYLAGLATLFEVINDPERYGEDYVRNLAAAFTVPNALRQTASTIDPVKREARTLMDEVLKRVPGFSDQVKASRDIFGEVVEYGGGLGPDLMSPIYTSNASGDPVRAAIAELGVDIERVPSKIGETDLTDDQYEYWQISAGQGMRKDIEKLMRSRDYKRADSGSEDQDSGKTFMIKQVISAHKQKGKGMLLQKYPELQEVLKQEANERKNRFLGLIEGNKE